MALVELKGIHFAYPHHDPVLKGADLSLEDGERLCITGHNGAVYDLAFSPDGTRIVAGVNDNAMMIWSAPRSISRQ